MQSDSIQETIAKAITARQTGMAEEAFGILTDLVQLYPGNPDINYQMAWTCDCLGKETEAAHFYEKALQNGISGDEKRGAMLGLGSTYRCIGQFEKSIQVFNEAIKEFPADRSFRVFRSLSLHNLGKSSEALGELLIQLLDTTSDSSIKTYDRALRLYAEDVNLLS